LYSAHGGHVFAFSISEFVQFPYYPQQMIKQSIHRQVEEQNLPKYFPTRGFLLVLACGMVIHF
jgi:hypothetical protein